MQATGNGTAQEQPKSGEPTPDVIVVGEKQGEGQPVSGLPKVEFKRLAESITRLKTHIRPDAENTIDKVQLILDRAPNDQKLQDVIVRGITEYIKTDVKRIQSALSELKETLGSKSFKEGFVERLAELYNTRKEATCKDLQGDCEVLESRIGYINALNDRTIPPLTLLGVQLTNTNVLYASAIEGYIASLFEQPVAVLQQKRRDKRKADQETPGARLAPSPLIGTPGTPGTAGTASDFDLEFEHPHIFIEDCATEEMTLRQLKRKLRPSADLSLKRKHADIPDEPSQPLAKPKPKTNADVNVNSKANAKAKLQLKFNGQAKKQSMCDSNTTPQPVAELPAKPAQDLNSMMGLAQSLLGAEMGPQMVLSESRLGYTQLGKERGIWFNGTKTKATVLHDIDTANVMSHVLGADGLGHKKVAAVESRLRSQQSLYKLEFINVNIAQEAHRNDMAIAAILQLVRQVPKLKFRNIVSDEKSLLNIWGSLGQTAVDKLSFEDMAVHLDDEAIVRASMVRQLSFTHCTLHFLNRPSCEALCGLVARTTTIAKLKLKKCNLSDADLRHVEDALKTNTSLRKIDLSYNKVSLEGFTNLLLSCQQNLTLTELNLKGNLVSYQDIGPNVTALLEGRPVPLEALVNST